MKISPLAVVDPKAELADDVEVGPFCVIGPDVKIGAGCRLMNNVTVLGHTTIGRNNVIHPNAVLGNAPQDRKYRGSPTRLEIGDNNTFREACTAHVGTEKGGGITRIGSNNLFMVNVHIGHDGNVGSFCTLANNVMLAGHVHVGDYINMMGAVGIHHFVTVGEFCMLGAVSRIHHDVPPFVKVDGADMVRGINVKWLRATGKFSEDDITALEDACRKLFYHEKPVAVVMAEYELTNGINKHVKRLIEFLRQRDLGVHGRYRESLRSK